MAGRCWYFWKENFAKFARKPLKQCKILSSAARDTVTWNLGRCMALREAAPATTAPGPSSESRRPPMWLSDLPQVGEDSGMRGSWMLAQSLSPGQVATP